MNPLSDGARAPHRPSGHDLASLGPSDSSDGGSDSAGTRDAQSLAGDSDATGTGEGATAEGLPGSDGADILPDRLFLTPQAFDGDAASADPWLDERPFDVSDCLIDAPGSALDNPDLLDTSADVRELVQEEEDAGDEEAPSQDLDGFTQESAQSQRSAPVAGWPGHRGVE